MFCSPEPQGSAVTNTQEAKAFKKLAAHPRWFIESLVEGKSMEGKGAQTTILVLKHPWTRQVKANHELFLLKFLKGWTRDIKDIQPESHHPEPPVEPSGPRAAGPFWFWSRETISFTLHITTSDVSPYWQNIMTTDVWIIKLQYYNNIEKVFHIQEITKNSKW